MNPRWFQSDEGYVETLRARLTTLRDKTADAAAGVRPTIYWVGDHAELARINDDMRAGASDFRRAHRVAVAGLAALDGDDLGRAELWLDTAQQRYVAALEARLGAQDLERLTTSAKRRGRSPAKAETQASANARRFVENVDALMTSAEMTQIEAIRRVCAQDRGLKELLPPTPDGRRKALQRARKRHFPGQ